jgi:hypothetical protein
MLHGLTTPRGRNVAGRRAIIEETTAAQRIENVPSVAAGMTANEKPMVAVRDRQRRVTVALALPMRRNGTADEKPVAGFVASEGAGDTGGVSHCDALP